MTQPRLLVTLRPDDGLRSAIARHLPEVPWQYATDGAPGPWPEVTAMLVGDLRRELPAWVPSDTPALRFVQRVWTGLDRFPFERVPPSVEVAGNVGAFGEAVGEHAVVLLLALAHDVRGNHELVRQGRLDAPETRREVRGGIAVLLGFGAIASEVARRLAPFGVRVRGVARRSSPDPLAERIYPSSELRAAVADADFVIDCRPLTLSTRGTIDESVLRSMKPTAIYVNVGRGGTVDEEALYRHLVAHPEFRAGTDVWWDEDRSTGRLGARFPFGDLPNFLGSPHNAAEGADSEERSRSLALENLARFFSGARPRHIADRRDYVRE